MFIFLGTIGIISLVLSYLHFFRPDATITLNKFASRVVVTMDDMIKYHRMKLGVMYLAIAALLIYIGFFMEK